MVKEMKRFPVLALAILAASAVLAASAIPASAGGVQDWNKPMCGSNDFERVKTPQTEYAIVDSAGTCVNSWKHAPTFYISKVTSELSYQYPSADSGFVPQGEATCASSKDTCFAYPVRQECDGTPVASFKAWLNPGWYALAFDTWFSPVKSRHSYATRSGDTEVMIWLKEPGKGSWAADFRYYTTIDHIRFGVMSWEQASGVRYVAYVAAGQAGPIRKGGELVSYSNLWLNPFWRDAISHGWLEKSEWLWAIDLGFELSGEGTISNIHDYTLRDVK